MFAVYVVHMLLRTYKVFVFSLQRLALIAAVNHTTTNFILLFPISTRHYIIRDEKYSRPHAAQLLHQHTHYMGAARILVGLLDRIAMVVLPVHLNGSHWCLLAVDMRSCTFSWLDSMVCGLAIQFRDVSLFNAMHTQLLAQLPSAHPCEIAN